MRELRTIAAVKKSGHSDAHIRWARKTSRWTHVIHGVIGRGPEPPSKLDVGRATALATDGVCHGLVAGELHRYDNVKAGDPEVWVPRSANAERPGVRRKTCIPEKVVLLHGVRCLSADDTLLELADRLDDDGFEQALECGLRKGYVTREQIASWRHPRVRRVIDARGGLDVPHTDSLLETLAIQLIRSDPSLPTPTRQLRIFDERSQRYVARVDLCWPELGIFLELDGQQHKDQPVYDAVRQNKVTAATGWRCIRLTWDQVNFHRAATLRDLADCLIPA